MKCKLGNSDCKCVSCKGPCDNADEGGNWVGCRECDLPLLYCPEVK